MRWWALAAIALCGCLVDNPQWGIDTDAGPASATTSATTVPSMTAAASTSSTSVGGTGTGSEAPAYADVVLEDRPLAYWRLGDETTPTAADQMGSYPGEYQGSVMLGEGGLASPEDSAVRFGFGTRIVMGDVLDLAGDPSLTFEVWINSDVADDTWPRIMTKTYWGDPVGEQGYLMELTPDGRLSCVLFSDGIWNGVNAPIELGQTVHAVVTHDGVTLRLYINAVEVNSHTEAQPLRNTDAPFTVGSNSLEGGGSHYYGVLDEIAIYDYPLSAAQIERHYQMGVLP